MPEKRYQGKTKAELDEGKARCSKILWPLTVHSREGNVHREAHETTFCTSQLLHTSAPLTHQHTWTILLAMDDPPDTLTASGFQKNLNRNLLHCRNKARALPQDCKSSRMWCALQQHSSIRKGLAFKTQQKLLFDYLFFSPAVDLWEILNSSTKALAICCIYSELLPVLVICTPFR